MSQCRNHPDREAVAVCTACGGTICEECVAPGAADSPVCLDCSITETQRRLERDDQTVAAPGAAGRKRSQISPAMRVVIAIGALVILAELGVIYLMSPAPAPASSLAERGSIAAEHLATAQAAADLIVVREALEAYHRDHEAYPETLDPIRSELPVQLAAVLDGSGIRYERTTGGHYKLHSRGAGTRPLVLDSSAVVITMEDTP